MTDTPETPTEPDPVPVHEMVPPQKPPYMVVGDSFFAQMPEGELRLPMRLKTKLIRNIPKTALLDGLREQMYYLLAADTKLIEKIDELDDEDSNLLANKWFQAYQERQRARLGESGRSSTN